jgi:hypothetical protein
MRHQWQEFSFGATRAMTSIGSFSFWQQDQNFWARSQQTTRAQALSSAVIDQMFGATTTLSTGLASIANQTALDRVNTALTAAVQSALNPSASSTSSSSTPTASPSASGSSSPAVTFAAPATGTGKVPLTSGTPLLGLGFLTRGNFTVSDGTFTTTYQSTGTDTVGNLISAINSGASGNARVRAWLNGSGNLVVTSLNEFDTVTVGGDYAAALGFGTKNDTFAPIKPPPATTAAASSSTSASGSHSSSNSSSSTTGGGASKRTVASGIPNNSALALLTGGTAELLLASSGSPGSILDMFA